MNQFDIEHTLLGKSTAYPDQYDVSCLQAIPRQAQDAVWRQSDRLPFYGADVWNMFEVSWLQPSGQPCVALATCVVPCESPNLIESKSMKLYFNGLNQACFPDAAAVRQVIQQDLSAVVGASVDVALHALSAPHLTLHSGALGVCLDELSVPMTAYVVSPTDLTVVPNSQVTETVYTDCFRSLCLATGQPDWATVTVSYTGTQITHASLLRYLIGYRQHREFHEHCVERIFYDLLTQCHPTQLTVSARFTRRGGIDINPTRSTHPVTIQNHRLIRQ